MCEPIVLSTYVKTTGKKLFVKEICAKEIFAEFIPQINQKIAHSQKFIPYFFSFSHPQKFIPQNNDATSLF